ncbi:MAG: tetratricopeptide repeat protein [Planctomycetota bacterium]|jgi:non-specific serine/threonine protein kinase/serine/threonine-protein kinase
MDSERFSLIKEIFQAALARDPKDRPGFLDEACEGDKELRNEVERLLFIDSESKDFLETPATTGLPPGWTDTSLVGTMIGKYHLERIISSGGMGTVYEAMQEHPKRTVAVKVMKQGIVSRSALRRFEYEAQIMANLTHPHIAQVIEAGTYGGEAAVDAPFLVMEYITEALPITQYVRINELPTKDRLALFLQVCEAVHYGHQKGVIHRDLKPSNILVDGQGQVKVIDFGIARATDSDLAMTTVQTEIGQLLGTLQYMSPEQCEADPSKLDIRSDIYALGVVLYEVLCEALPYDVQQAAMLEAARLIREEPPKRPSSVNRTLRGDVETIVLKALEKEQRRRYQTVMAFETDIQRYLRGEVILAKPAGPWIRFVKYVKRNPVSSAAIGAVLLCLIAFVLYVVLWSYPRLQEEKAKLEVEMGNTLMINDFLKEMLSWADPFKEGGEVKVSELLDRAAERIDQEFPDRPEIEASLRHTLGVTYNSNGRFEAAEIQIEKSLDLYRRLYEEDDPLVWILQSDLALIYTNQGRFEEAEALYRVFFEKGPAILGESHEKFFKTISNRASLYMEQGRYGDSERLFKETIDRQRRVIGKDHPDTITSVSGLAILYEKQSRFDEAKALILETIDSWQRVKGNDHPYTLSERNNLASLYVRQGRYQEAAPLLEEVLEATRRLLGEDHPHTIKMLGNLASSYSAMGRYEEAETAIKDALEGKRRVYGENHPDTLYGLRELAVLYGNVGRFDEAESLLIESLEGNRRTLGDDHQDTLNVLNDLAQLYWNYGRYDQAEPLFQEALERKRRVLGDDHHETYTALNNLASLYFHEERYDEAEPLFKEALEGKRRHLGEDSLSTLSTLNNLASLYMKQERYAEAEPLFTQVVEGLKGAFGEDNPNTLGMMVNLAVLYERQERYAESEPIYLIVLEGQRRTLGDDHWHTLDTMTGLGRLYTKLGRLEEAEPLLTGAVEGKRRELGDDNPKTLAALYRLIELYERQERFEEAAPLAQELLESTPEDSPKFAKRKEMLDRIMKKVR